MPPTRTVAPIRTERTHEENQERAYVAASRRSDRSIEARVESAKRASEIHKKRTGRSLRVREEDVLNEEMYEEEEDESTQYRRFQALQNSAFNGRLSSYLAANVAVRTYYQQQIDNSFLISQANSMGQSLNPQLHPQPPPPPMVSQMYTPQSQEPIIQQHRSPTYRQAPYPSPRQPQGGFQPNSHQRSTSIANPINTQPIGSPISPPLSENTRRMSMPTPPVSADSPNSVRTPGSSSTPQIKQRPSFPSGSFSRENLGFQAGAQTSNTSQGQGQDQSQPQANPQHEVVPEPQNANTAQNNPEQPQASLPAFGNTNTQPSSWKSFNQYFSPVLPANVQGLIGSALDPSNPYTNTMMAGSQNLPGSFYSFSQTLPEQTNGQQTHPSIDGLTSTLAPAATQLNDKLFSDYFSDMLGGTNGGNATPAPSNMFGYEFSGNMFDIINWGEEVSSSQNSQG